MLPQPISVGTTGTLRISASSTSRSEASALMMPPPGDDQRPLGGRQHVDRLLGLGSRWPPACRPAAADSVSGSKSISASWTSMGRSISTGPGRPERIRWNACCERAWDLAGFEHRHRHLGDRRGDGGDVDGLKVLLVESGHRRLAGDREDRNGIR